MYKHVDLSRNLIGCKNYNRNLVVFENFRIYLQHEISVFNDSNFKKFIEQTFEYKYVELDRNDCSKQFVCISKLFRIVSLPINVQYCLGYLFDTYFNFNTIKKSCLLLTICIQTQQMNESPTLGITKDFKNDFWIVILLFCACAKKHLFCKEKTQENYIKIYIKYHDVKYSKG